MGLFDFLFKNQQCFNRKARLLEWQSVVLDGDYSELYLSEQQLNEISKQQAENRIRIIRDSARLVESTSNPDVFFSRLQLLSDCTEHLVRLEKFISFSDVRPSKAAEQLHSNFQISIKEFLIRCFENVSSKAESLKTEKARISKYLNLYETLLGYYDMMNEENINYIESKISEHIELPSCNENKYRAKNSIPKNPVFLLDIPYGWKDANRDFLKSIEQQFSTLLNQWLESRNVDTSPKTKVERLEVFISFLEETASLCSSKGKYFESWFYRDVATPDYIDKRRSELSELLENLEKLSDSFNRRMSELVDLDIRIKQKLIENDGILQSDFGKLFDESIRNDVREKLYSMEKEGRLQRIKSGRSYILHYKN